jgi:SAM-dependent MidA family methyltransferase
MQIDARFKVNRFIFICGLNVHTVLTLLFFVVSRLKMLLDASRSEEERLKLTSGLKMLTDADQMGHRFKMMAIRKFDFNQAPPGFLQEEKN